jgi:hypothetical protein
MIDARRPQLRPLRQGLSLAVLLATATPATLLAQDQVDDSHGVRTGAAALGDWRADAPGVWRKITPADLPQPFATPSASNTPGVVARPARR